MATTMDAYHLNSGMRCAKYMLLVISLMFAITSVLLIMVGSTIQTILGDFRQFIDDSFLSPSGLMIASGVLMLLVAFLGAIGAIKEYVLFINLYGVCLFLVFILEVTAATLAFALQGDVRSMLLRTMNDSLLQYSDNQCIQDAVDFMQSGLQCCGIESPMDWKFVPTLNPKGIENFDNDIVVPRSCCGEFSEIQSDECIVQYSTGCLMSLNFILSQSAMLIAIGATTVAFVQLLGVVCAFMLAKTLRRNKSIREARRWQLQQSLGILVSDMKTTFDNPPLVYTQLEKNEGDLERLEHPITYTACSPSVN